MRPVAIVKTVTNPYVNRILSYVIGKDPLKVLSTTPGRIRQLIRGLSDTQIRRPPAKGKLSIAQIIAHL